MSYDKGDKVFDGVLGQEATVLYVEGNCIHLDVKGDTARYEKELMPWGDFQALQKSLTGVVEHAFREMIITGEAVIGVEDGRTNQESSSQDSGSSEEGI